MENTMSTERTNETPLVSIITPTWNSEKYLEETLRSVRDQTYNNIEHIVVDSESTDGTHDILHRFEDQYDLSWSSGPDENMYDAIEKGFYQANGQVFAWLNSDDKYLPWAVKTAVEWLSRTGIQWVTGMHGFWDEAGRLKRVAPIQPHYRQKWLQRGWYHGKALGWVQQESTFWTASLWEKAGGFPSDIQMAGDYYLWKQFADHAELITIPTLVAGIRKHPEQISADRDAYFAEIDGPHPVFAKVLSKSRLHFIYSLSQIVSKSRG
jgi:glycosyltransferase involved in cell wall biosynthesis